MSQAINGVCISLSPMAYNYDNDDDDHSHVIRKSLYGVKSVVCECVCVYECRDFNQTSKCTLEHTVGYF